MSDLYYLDLDGNVQTKQLGDYDGERNDKGQRHGKGKATLPNGDVYIGSYHNGKRHGQGTYYFTSCNARYTGNYLLNVKSGQGTMWYPDGSKYEGSWQDDEKHNFGVYTYPNKDVYTGEWENGQRNGNGVYKCATSNVTYKGTWLKGKIQGVCQIIHTNHKYIGMFQDNLPCGHGQYIFNAGYRLLGKYILQEQRKEGMFMDDEDFDNRIPVWSCLALEQYPPGLVMEDTS